jgi:hypothetical protein
MKKVIIIAKDKEGTVLGQREVEKPENWDEFLATFDEEQIMKYTWSNFAIDVQQELRTEARGGSKESPLVKAFKKLSPEDQQALLEKNGK